MRLVTYGPAFARRPGLVVDNGVLDTAAVAASGGLGSPEDTRWSSNRTVLQGGPRLLEDIRQAAERYSGEPVATFADVSLGPPVTDPDKIICLGLNYRDHAEESGLDLPKAPMLFAKFRNSLAGPHDPIVLPPVGEKIDYEAELAVVIGSRCKDVEEPDALAYVAGAMVLNDVTARDVQHQTSQWTAGKAIDTFAPCGPSLVLLDELGDLQDLDISARVNDRLVQDSNTSQMIFSVAETVAFLSRLMTLEPGDIIATGTPAGVGISRDPQVLLREGDTVGIAVGGIGSISNTVVAGPVRHTALAADREIVR